MTTAMIANPIQPLIQGFLLSISMIIVIGPQNLFILRQGLLGKHLFAVALFSSLANLLFITVGVGGVGVLIASNSNLEIIITLGGVVFLLWCGIRSLLSAYRPSTPTQPDANNTVSMGIKTTILAVLGFSLLNPATYFDTLVILGSKSMSFPIDQRVIFAIGAVLASFIWFFVLTYGASKMSSIFRSPIAWRTLDMVSGCLMVAIAGSIVMVA